MATFRYHLSKEEAAKPRGIAGRELLVESLSGDAKPQTRLGALISGLSSEEAVKRASASVILKKYVDDLGKARDVIALLPPDDADKPQIAGIRAHCIGYIRKSIR
ncbi:MAG TPA: hypothetical protein VLD37_04970 [Candidatus Bilamarchaeum sp.]|nr:hypothetical protein [Candidatus Bilamarchaeum sp.]